MSILRTKPPRRPSDVPRKPTTVEPGDGQMAALAAQPGVRPGERDPGSPSGPRDPVQGREPGGRRRLWRPREAGAAAAATVGWGALALARLVLAAATLIALLI